MPAWSTAGKIVSQVATEVGLGPNADPFAAVDPNFVQLCALLASVGQEIVLLRKWTHLVVPYNFATVENQSSYALPADFREMIDQTGWNRSTRLPIQVVSAQQWEYVQALAIGVTLNVLFRLLDQTLQITPAPATAGQTIAFEYISSNWCAAAGNTPTKDTPSASSDIVFFDKLLMVKALKLAFLADKGFDTTAAQQKYDDVLELVKGADSASPILRIGGGSQVGPPLLGTANIPITGFGLP